LLSLALAACGGGSAAATGDPGPPAGTPIAVKHAQTFKVVERDGYRIVDMASAIVDWGGGARGQPQNARLVLVPHDVPAPALVGDLAGATIIRTPVKRIATNAGPHEAILTALGVVDRLVAVGGTHSYNRAIRNRVLRKELLRIGYGWHSPPELDVMVAARPDIFLMALADLGHVDHLERIKALGIPVLPTFIDTETDYMGRVDYIRLFGMLTGREREAEAYASRIEARVEELKGIADKQPKQPLLWAWHASGDRWGALVRNAEAGLARDAGAVNLLEEPDDPRRDSLRFVSTERLLHEGTSARCWIIRDDQSPPFSNQSVLQRFAAKQNRCLYSITGRMRPDHNAYDYYETAVIRPDLLLEDLIAMLHPQLRVGGGHYIVPDREALAL
jgi:iron complex transport system substrate-binding protein